MIDYHVVFQCSHDLFDENTVEKISQRFRHVLSQLFLTNSSEMVTNLSTYPIRELSLILPRRN